MCSTSIFPCIMTMISNFMILFTIQMFFYKYNRFFAFSYDLPCSFVNSFILFFLKLIIFIGCYFKNSQNFFIQSLLLYSSCLFSRLLNEDFVDIEKVDGIFLLTFVVHQFSGLFLHRSVFSIIHSRSA